MCVEDKTIFFTLMLDFIIFLQSQKKNLTIQLTKRIVNDIEDIVDVDGFIFEWASSVAPYVVGWFEHVLVVSKAGLELHTK